MYLIQKDLIILQACEGRKRVPEYRLFRTDTSAPSDDGCPEDDRPMPIALGMESATGGPTQQVHLENNHALVIYVCPSP